MPALRHPYTRSVYDLVEPGVVQVVTVAGVCGLFDATGTYLSGDLRHCDPLLAQWVAGPQVAHHRLQQAKATGRE